MSPTTFLIQCPITHPRKITCVFLLLTVLSILLFLSHTQQSTTALLAKGPPWTKMLHAEQPMAAQEILTVGIFPNSEEAGIFTPAAFSLFITLDQTLQSFARVTSTSPQILANDYLAPGNIDLATPGDLGAITLTPFLNATLDVPQLTEATVQQALQSPLLNNIFISQDEKAIALRLPCLISGKTQEIQQQLQHAAINQDPQAVQLLFSGLSFARENFFREMEKNTLPLMCASLALIVAVSLLTVFASGYSCIFILPVACSTSLTLALQTLVQLPAGLFSFTPPLIAACTSLLFSIWLIATLNSRLPEKEKHPSFIAREMKTLLPQLWLTSLASAGALLCLCFSSLATVRFLGFFGAISILLAFISSVMAVPATCILLPPSWRSVNKNQNKISKGLAVLAKHTTQSALPGKLAYICANHCSLTVAAHILFLVLGMTGIMLVTINATPVQWYAKKHWIQTANQKIIQHFAGVDQLNLVFSANVVATRSINEARQWLSTTLKNTFDDAPSFYTSLEKDIEQTVDHLHSTTEFSSRLTSLWRRKMNALHVEDDVQINHWSIALDTLAQMDNEKQTFLKPAVLAYLADLQQFLEQLPEIGKTLSVVDIVESMHQALFEGASEYKRIPTTIGSVDQTLAAFKEKRPTPHLARFITADATTTTLTLYLKNSSARSIEAIVQATASYFKTTPPPVPLDYFWAGSAYGFKIWNEKTVLSLILWSTVGLITGCLIFSFARRSLTCGLALLAVIGYPLICAYGICGLIGMRLATVTMAAITILFPVSFCLTSIMLHSAGKKVKEYGCCQDNLQEQLTATYFPVIWSVAAVISGATPALFSAYYSLQTTAFMTISFMFMQGITFFTLLPLLFNLLESRLFKKELPALDEAKEQAAVTADWKDSMDETTAHLSLPADTAAVSELKDVFAPQKNTDTT